MCVQVAKVEESVRRESVVCAVRAYMQMYVEKEKRKMSDDDI